MLEWILHTNLDLTLIDAPNVLISSRSKPLCNTAAMIYGNKPSDGGYLILKEEEKNAIIAKEPAIAKYIYPYIGAVEYINRKVRYCLWLVDVKPKDLKESKELHTRIMNVQAFREASTAAPTRAKANIPHLFFFISQPKSNYLIVPRVSSERRKYVPIGFMSPDIIASDSCSIIPDATLYHFGVMVSNVHMAWMRTIAGRLKSDYRYSGSVVYNNFPWCTPTEEQRKRIEQTAQAILDARAKYPDSSFADLYDSVTMPADLRKAHQQNDRAVMQAYGFNKDQNSESACVAALMQMYSELAKTK